MQLVELPTILDFLWFFFFYSFSGPESSSAESSPKTQQEESRRGSFRVFRSNSWSSRKKKNPEVLPVTEGGQAPQLSPNNEAIIEAQRCSPSSYSTKSQDSGFSDVPQVAGDQLRTSASQLIQNQRLQFLRSSMEVKEDDKDPNLTQMPQGKFIFLIKENPAKVCLLFQLMFQN